VAAESPEGGIDTWFDHLLDRAITPRFGIHEMLEDRRLRVESANPARGALLRRILEVAGYEIVYSALGIVDGIVTDGGAQPAAGLPVIDATTSSDAGAFLGALRRSLTAKPAVVAAN
jgi:hypothetical protein